MSSISSPDKDQLARRLGVDLTDCHQAATFNALVARYGLRLTAALRSGWFDGRTVAPATAHAYRKKYVGFRKWATSFGLRPLPASVETVKAYAESRLKSGVKASTIGRELDAIDWMHRTEGYAQPGQTAQLKEWKAGAARCPDQEPLRQSFPLQPEHLRQLVRAVKGGALDWSRGSQQRNMLKRLRCIAFFLFMFATGMRVSDATRLKASWITVDADGWATVTAPRSKNYPRGTSYRLYPACDPRWCPVRALIAWVEAATQVGGLPNGRLFARVNCHGEILSDPLAGLKGERLWAKIGYRAGEENRLLRMAADQAGFDWDGDRQGLSSRSLRRGLATAAHQASAEVSHIQKSLGHRLHTTTARYVEGQTGLAEGSAARVVLS